MKTPTSIAKLSAAVVAILASTLIYPSTADAALSDCPSGYMCVWSGTNYSGSLQKFSATSQRLTISLLSVDSYYNNRTRRTYYTQYANGTGNSSCLSAGTRAADLSGWKNTAKGVYLSTTTSC